ncbi:hypothetical protein CP979_02575 [Streptomyces filamentosus]|nr:hypothetical protein CP979_02575 [Streptomyces filamentosus]
MDPEVGGEEHDGGAAPPPGGGGTLHGGGGGGGGIVHGGGSLPDGTHGVLLDGTGRVPAVRTRSTVRTRRVAGTTRAFRTAGVVRKARAAPGTGIARTTGPTVPSFRPAGPSGCAGPVIVPMTPPRAAPTVAGPPHGNRPRPPHGTAVPRHERTTSS